ncbi:helix-turn-helix domain-containing protein [Bifidobacterium phasiani]|uniref:Helix-turn-helix transcriptional regulator n=1 Tax=Bifidobacterium phasiani TaxID=2834431 RepID=A0ABS6WAF8_9BIFI|nr:helix-turn-helix transcriptional regulator [Bifidobacterium phasiani]MBW3083464.1 helix-turn-helix transcriptional regulator [Bifidobacterium phasiani]
MTKSDSYNTNLFYERIKCMLVLRGIWQKDAARALGISSASFSDKLKGDIRFSADEIAKLADLFGVSTDVLLGREPLEVV